MEPMIGKVVIDHQLRLGPLLDVLAQARQLRPRAGVDTDEGVERVERQPLGPTGLGVVVGDVVLEINERVLPRQVAQQQNLGVNSPPFQTEHERRS